MNLSCPKSTGFHTEYTRNIMLPSFVAHGSVEGREKGYAEIGQTAKFETSYGDHL